MSLYTNYGTNKSLEVEGVWVDYGGGAKLKLGRAGPTNPTFKRLVEKNFRAKAGTKNRVRNIAEEEAREKIIQTYAQAVVLDWEGVTDENGNPLTFSKENVVKVFTDLPDFFNLVQEDAQNYATFQQEAEEEDQGNSVTASDGT